MVNEKRRPNGSGREPKRKPGGSGKKPKRKPGGSGKKPKRKPGGSGKEPKRKPGGSGKKPKRKPGGSGKEPKRKPGGSGKEPKRKPGRSGRKPKRKTRWKRQKTKDKISNVEVKVSAVVIEMSQMSDSKELYHSKPPAACVAFLYTTFILCIVCLMWICTGRINIIIEGNATIVTLQKQNTRQLENEKEYWIQMLVSSCEIQWVEPGMTIRCSMEALPASEYGFVEGHITEVSSQLYIDSKGQGYYLVTARLDSTTLTGSSGRIAALQEQMFGKAKILAGTQSVLHYLQNHVK